MPKDGNFKKLIRERMAKTGESYTTARHQLLQRGEAGDDGEGDVGAGSDAMPMFARRWSAGLPLARDWARLYGSDTIEPEHLLLGVLDAGGPPLELLLSLKVSTPAVRYRVEAGLRTQPGGPSNPTFSERTKEVLVMAVDEEDVLAAAHAEYALLLALASEGGLAAVALAEFGATAERLHDAVLNQPTVPNWAVAALTRCVADMVGEEVAERIRVWRDEPGIRVDVHTRFPGKVIGRRGAIADRLRAELVRVAGEPVFLNIFEVKT